MNMKKRRSANSISAGLADRLRCVKRCLLLFGMQSHFNEKPDLTIELLHMLFFKSEVVGVFDFIALLFRKQLVDPQLCRNGRLLWGQSRQLG